MWDHFFVRQICIKKNLNHVIQANTIYIEDDCVEVEDVTLADEDTAKSQRPKIDTFSHPLTLHDYMI